jgi:hypothetical protein
MDHSQLPLMPWHSMSHRAQAVWGAAYAASTLPGIEAARHADRTVSSLEAIEWPEAEQPEHRAARRRSGLTLAEFSAWYQVERRINASGQHVRNATQAEVEQAYTVYLMCGSDFY